MIIIHAKSHIIHSLNAFPPITLIPMLSPLPPQPCPLAGCLRLSREAYYFAKEIPANLFPLYQTALQ